MEYHEEKNVSLHLSQLTVICEFESQQQKIGLYQHPLLGKVLIINKEIHHIENYQHLYHEPLVHIPAAFIETPKSCLIIGGGSLFAASEVLKYPSIDKVVLCDYDNTVLELMAHNYEHAKQVKADKRFHYIERDARKFIKDFNGKFDLIINDCFDLAKMNRGFSMYEQLYQICSEQGVCSDVIYRHVFDKECTSSSLKLLKCHANVALSLLVIPEYPGVLHVLTIWGKNRNIHQNQKHTLNKYQQDPSNLNNFKMFAPSHLPYYLYLPPYIRELIYRKQCAKLFDGVGAVKVS